MFERFTGSARQTVVAAQDAARLLDHPYIGTEHLLLGLLANGDHVASRVLGQAGITRERVIADLERMRQEPSRVLTDMDTEALRTIGIDLDAVRAAVEESFGPGALDGTGAHDAGQDGPWWRRRNRPVPQPTGSPRGHIPFHPRAKKVLELSLREAMALKHGYIGTEHLLLGLLREGQGTATQIIREEGIEPEKLRKDVIAECQRAA